VVLIFTIDDDYMTMDRWQWTIALLFFYTCFEATQVFLQRPLKASQRTSSSITDHILHITYHMPLAIHHVFFRVHLNPTPEA
jgi:hypothetical protein